MRLLAVITLVLLSAVSAHAASYRTANFIVSASTPELAQKIGDTAEVYRRQEAIDWIGEAFPNWSVPCPITATVGQSLGAGGFTSFVFDRGEVFKWNMQIEGSRDRVLDSVLPHEVLHTIFATHFRRALPRWADEGACTSVEHVSERTKQQIMLVSFLHSGHGIAFDKLFAMKEYPHDVLPLYSEGYSLARFLIDQGGKRRFVQYMEAAIQNDDWMAATKTFYGIGSYRELQDKWLTWVKSGSPELHVAGMPEPDSVQLIDFRSDACEPCRRMDPIVSEMRAEGFDVQQVNVDQQQDLAKQFNVSSIPCFVAMYDGREISRMVGATDKGTLVSMCAIPKFLRPRKAQPTLQAPSLSGPIQPLAPLPTIQQQEQSGGSDPRIDNHEQRIGQLEQFDITIKRLADQRLPGNQVPNLVPIPPVSGQAAPAPAQPSASNPPAAPVPSLDSIGETLKPIFEKAVADKVQPIIDQGVQKIQEQVNAGIGQLPLSGEIKDTLAQANKKLVEDIQANVPGMVSMAAPLVQQAAAPILGAFISAIPGPWSLIGLPLAGGAGAYGLAALLGVLFKKKAALPAGDVAGTVKPIIDGAISELGTQLGGHFGQLTKQIGALVGSLGSAPSSSLDIFAAIKGVAADVAQQAPQSPAKAAKFVEQYFLNPAAADELAAKREVTQGMTKGQAGLLGQLHQEAMQQLTSGAFGGKTGKDLADAIEHWVMKQFLAKHGVRTSLAADPVLPGQAS